MIHPLAVVDPEAEIGEEVRIGPFAVVGPQVRIGDGCVIGPHVVIEGDTEIGSACMIYPHAVLGTPPQDIKYRGEPTKLVIASACVLREGVTINRGTGHGGGLTEIGEGCYLMATSHVGHDCRLGREIVIANNVALAGHVTVEDYACFGGLAGVHQFARIGAYCFIGAGAMVRRDVPPFAIAKGDRARISGVNIIGLRRRNFDDSRISAIEKTYLLLQAGKSERDLDLPGEDGNEDIRRIVEFYKASKVGVSRFFTGVAG